MAKKRFLTLHIDDANEDDVILLNFLDNTLPRSKREEWVKTQLLKHIKKLIRKSVG